MPGRRASLTEITPANPLGDYSRLALPRLQPQALDRRGFLAAAVTWVVVAEPHRAVIYGVPRGMARLREIRALGDSRPDGDHETPPGPGFATELIVYVEEARREGRFDRLILVAEPAYLAELRANLSTTLRDALIAEIGKNLIGAGREKLQEEVLRVL